MNEQIENFVSTLLSAFVRGVMRAWQGEGSASLPAPARGGRRARTRVASEPAPALAQVTPPSKPRAGHEIVRYRQGRGTFEARIVSFDRETKMITLERLSDGKRVERPSSKVYSA